MTLAELKTALESSGLPVAYLSFPEETCPDMPYVVYQETYKPTFGADDKVYMQYHHVQVDLYTVTKEPATEALIEAVLDAADIYYETESDPDNDELCHRQIYQMEI